MLPNGIVIQGVAVSEAELEVCDALIGMDTIALGDFLVTNKGHTKFAFRVPSEGSSPIGHLPSDDGVVATRQTFSAHPKIPSHTRGGIFGIILAFC